MEKRSKLEYLKQWRKDNKDYHKNYNREHRKHCIYTLSYQNEVLYIGGTCELQMRVSYHKTQEKNGKLLEIAKTLGIKISDIKIEYLELDSSFTRQDRNILEAHMIKLHKPKFNIAHNNNKIIDEEKVKEYISCLSDNWCVY